MHLRLFTNFPFEGLGCLSFVQSLYGGMFGLYSVMFSLYLVSIHCPLVSLLGILRLLGPLTAYRPSY